MAGALAGFYRASVAADLVYLAGNMTRPPVGIVQCYSYGLQVEWD